MPAICLQEANVARAVCGEFSASGRIGWHPRLRTASDQNARGRRRNQDEPLWRMAARSASRFCFQQASPLVPAGSSSVITGIFRSMPAQLPKLPGVG